MNAATRIRASCRGWRGRLTGVVLAGASVLVGAMVLVGASVLVGAGVAVGAGVGAGAVSEDAGPGMIPIRYVTDRFGFLEGRTG
jgi:hypothetical protein